MADESPRRSLRPSVHINLVSDHQEMYGKKIGNYVNMSSGYSFPRRSFCHLKQNSSIGGGDDNSPSMATSCSSFFPTYMAVTESAKAKTRSISTPRQRLPFLNDVSFWSSYDGDFVRSISNHVWELLSLKFTIFCAIHIFVLLCGCVFFSWSYFDLIDERFDYVYSKNSRWVLLMLKMNQLLNL